MTGMNTLLIVVIAGMLLIAALLVCLILRLPSSRRSDAEADRIGALLNPLKGDIEGFRKAVAECYINENATRRSLADQIDRLMNANHSLGEEARNLASALKGDSKVQGDWGESSLRTLLERAGLTAGINFTEQDTTDTEGRPLRAGEDDRLNRTDVIVHLPDRHLIVIDSKVSLKAFVDLCAASDPKERDRHTARHLASVRANIDRLAAKDYSSLLDRTVDYVLMFIPVEGAYMAAMQADPSLSDYAFSRRVAVVSPTHLFAVIKLVAQIWKQDDQNRNVMAIARKGADLYDKIVRFATEFEKIEKSIAAARKSYDNAYRLLVTGRGNVIRQTEMLRDLGVAARRPMPANMIADSEASTLTPPSVDESGRPEVQSER